MWTSLGAQHWGAEAIRKRGSAGLREAGLLAGGLLADCELVVDGVQRRLQ